MKPKPPARLHPLQAPAAGVAVIFRRGPSRHVEVIRWDMRRDAIERGHWFHGRIYERRCDLSPDGELLVYFAAKYGSRDGGNVDRLYSWTAVSRPPWLTALALWPKGDCWFGGGLFTARRHLRLNHRPNEATPQPGREPRGLAVEPDPEARGENDPLYSARLERDGWTLREAWELEMRGQDEFYVTHVPELRVRAHPTAPFTIELRRRIDRLKYRELFRVVGPTGEVALPVGRIDWVDWDATGRLFVLVDGTLRVATLHGAAMGELRMLADFDPDRFEERPTPAHARAW
jgi:hypothetical protein